MKIFKIFLILVLLPIIAVPANVYFTGTTSYGGTATQADSILVTLKYRDDDLATVTETFKIVPTGADVDTFKVTTNLHNRVNLFYKAWFGSDSDMFAGEEQILRFDSSDFKPTYWSKFDLVMGDSFYIYNSEKLVIADKVRDTMEVKGSAIWYIAANQGSFPGWITVYYPNNGTSPKDSIAMFDSLGVKQYSIHFRHPNSPNVLDTTEPYLH